MAAAFRGGFRPFSDMIVPQYLSTHLKISILASLSWLFQTPRILSPLAATAEDAATRRNATESKTLFIFMAPRSSSALTPLQQKAENQAIS